MPDPSKMFMSPKQMWQMLGAVEQPQTQENTILTPNQERRFFEWVDKNHVIGVDEPDSFYDMRGYWKDVVSKGGNETQVYPDGIHYPDTYKQHGHPTFSIESKYSKGPNDGGHWEGETFVPPLASPAMKPTDVPMATSRVNVDQTALYSALQRLLTGR